jgi:hypothetical protein
MARPLRTRPGRARAAVWARTGELAEVVGGRERAEEVMRDIVFAVTGQSSTKNLTFQDAMQVCDRISVILQDEGAPCRRPTTRAERRETEDGDAIVSREQSEAILALAEALGMGRPALRRWIRRHMASVCHGRTWPQTREQAIKIHEGLEAMLWRRPENSPESLRTRARFARTLPGVTEWERQFLGDLIQRFGQAEETPTNSGGFRRGWKQVAKLVEIEKARGGRAGGL